MHDFRINKLWFFFPALCHQQKIDRISFEELDIWEETNEVKRTTLMKVYWPKIITVWTLMLKSHHRVGPNVQSACDLCLQLRNFSIFELSSLAILCPRALQWGLAIVSPSSNRGDTVMNKNQTSIGNRHIVSTNGFKACLYSSQNISVRPRNR